MSQKWSKKELDVLRCVVFVNLCYRKVIEFIGRSFNYENGTSIFFMKNETFHETLILLGKLLFIYLSTDSGKYLLNSCLKTYLRRNWVFYEVWSSLISATAMVEFIDKSLNYESGGSIFFMKSETCHVILLKNLLFMYLPTDIGKYLLNSCLKSGLRRNWMFYDVWSLLISATAK